MKKIFWSSLFTLVIIVMSLSIVFAQVDPKGQTEKILKAAINKDGDTILSNAYFYDIELGAIENEFPKSLWENKKTKLGNNAIAFLNGNNNIHFSKSSIGADSLRELIRMLQYPCDYIIDEVRKNNLFETKPNVAGFVQIGNIEIYEIYFTITYKNPSNSYNKLKKATIKMLIDAKYGLYLLSIILASK